MKECVCIYADVDIFFLLEKTLISCAGFKPSLMFAHEARRSLRKMQKRLSISFVRLEERMLSRLLHRFKDLGVKARPEVLTTVQDSFGLTWLVSNKMALDRHLICNGQGTMIPMSVRKILNMLPSESIAIDVGANAGYWTLHLAQFFSKVYAYEPDKLSFEKLERNLDLNKSSLHEVLIRSCAVGNFNGEMNFYSIHLLDDDKLINSGLSGFYDRTDSKKSESVPCIKLDSEFESELSISFLKIDVEGAESKVFYGAELILDRSQPIIFWEASRILEALIKTTNIAQCVEVLNKFEYKHYAFLQNGKIIRSKDLQEKDLQECDFDVLSVPGRNIQFFNSIAKIIEATTK
jgi:FkbM family methyltransferase